MIQSGNTQTGTVGALLAQPLVVKVTDAGGNPVPGASVVWAATNGTIVTPTTTAADGTTSNTLTLAHASGAASATATVSGVAPATFTATANADVATQIVFTAQPTAVASGAAITPAVVVALRDQYGNTTTSTSAVSIGIGANPANGALHGTLTQNAVNGLATFNDLSIDKAGVGYTLLPSSSGLTALPSTPLNVTPGAAAHIAIVAGDNVTGIAGTPATPPPQVRVTDAAGNNVQGATVVFTVTSGAGTTLPASPASVNTDVSGLATLTSWVLGPIAGANTIDASIGAGGTVTFHASSASGIGAVISLVSGNAQTGTVGTALIAPLVVHVADASNNAVVGAVVSWTATNGTIAPTSVTDANGNASATLTLGHVAGASASTATATILNGQHVSFNESATAGVPTALAITTQPSTTAASSAITPAITVGLRDAFGNVATGANAVTIAIDNNPGGATLSGTKTQTAVNGTATFGDLLIPKAGVGYTLTVTSSGLTSATTNPFNVVAGPAAQLAFTTQPLNTTGGATIAAVTVTLSDAFGNTATGSTAAVTIAIAANPATGTLSGTLTRNAVNGVATFNDLSIDHAGTGYTLSAASPGLQTATSSAFSISVGAPAHIAVIAGDGQSALVDQNTAIAPKVKITDAGGNVVPNASVTFSVITGGGSIKLAVGTAPVTTGIVTSDAGGLAAIGSWQLGHAPGANTLEARVSPSLAVTFTASATNTSPSTITIISGNPQSGTVATALAAPLVVQVMDVAGAPVAGAAVSWTATNGTLSAMTFTGADGTTSNTLTLGKVAGASSAIATIVNGQQQTFSATALAGPATDLHFTSQPPSTTVGVVLLPAITLELRDQFGNVAPIRNSVTLSLDPAAGNLSGTLTRNAVNGVVTFNDIAVNVVGTGYKLIANSAGLTSDEQRVQRRQRRCLVRHRRERRRPERHGEHRGRCAADRLGCRRCPRAD